MEFDACDFAVFRIIHTTPGGSSSRGDFRIPDLDVENVNFRIVVDFQGSSFQDFSTFEVRYRCYNSGIRIFVHGSLKRDW